MPEENVVVARSWTDLIEQLYVDSWDEGLSRFRSSYAFRGLSDTASDLRTSLVRHGGRYAELEYHIMRNFVKYARVEASGQYSIWNWLVIAQHHGLPTRLLDWTFSPFVAMHFATCNLDRYDRDGAIWCVDFVAMHERLPEPLRAALEEEGANGFTVEMLSHVATTLKEFDGLSEEDFVVFFDPPSMNYRIVNQFAMHSVISNPKTSLDEILTRSPDLFRKVVLPKELKWEVRDKLDQANINERVLLPGLEGLCRWLTRHYTPKG